MSPPKNILVLGASGKSGLRTVERALKGGHKVVAYLRNDTTLTEETKRNPNLTVCCPLNTFLLLLVCFCHLINLCMLPDS
jgi:nucleoside-diphosphate-sugar epimerase